MAGHASNWFKAGGGSAKGRVFVSNAALATAGLSKQQASGMGAALLPLSSTPKGVAQPKVVSLDSVIKQFIPYRSYTTKPHTDGVSTIVSVDYGGSQIKIKVSNDPEKAKEALSQSVALSPKLALQPSGTAKPKPKPVTEGKPKILSYAKDVGSTTSAPVSEAFDIAPPDKKADSYVSKVAVASKTALDAINAVHTDGKLPKIPILPFKQHKSGETTMGYYQTFGVMADKIRLYAKSSKMGMTLVHEIGHFLDHQALGLTGKWASKDPNSPAAALIKTIRDSQAVSKLTALGSADTITTPDGKTHSVSSKYVGYLLKPEELFARAYAQYIATRSGSAELQAQLAASKATISAGTSYPRQWDADDFEPIAVAFDQLFAKKGWK